MKAVLFLGGMFPKDSKLINEKSKGSIQNAANVFQWNVAEGFLKQREEEIFTFLSAPFLGSWPFGFSDICVNEKTLEDSDLLEYVSFLNIPIVKNISRYYSCLRAVKKWLERNVDNEKYIVIYSAHTPFVAAVNTLKKKYSFVMHLIVPDLPQYMVSDNQKTTIYRFLKSIDIKIQKSALRGVDSYTFLTDKMSKMMNLNNKAYVVVEGMINSSEYIKREYHEKKQKTVVYSGGLSSSYGVKNLVDAAEYLDPNIKLILCGAGELEEYIREKSKQSNNIVFYGQIPREKVLTIQAEATVLINPRQNNEEYTKYSFPSKLLEYMLSGNPILCYKLDGIPDEYDDVLMYFEDTDPEGMSKKINEVCAYSGDKLSEIHDKIVSFALKRKNESIQCKKILQCVFSGTNNTIR